MKPQLFASITTLLTTTLAFFSDMPTHARPVQYSCSMIQGVPTTIARTRQGTVAVITWKSQYFGANYTPERRCQIVSERFQKHANQGTLKYVTVGKMNGENVMCVAKGQGGGCRTDGLLITFESRDNPYTVIKELFGVSGRAGGGPASRGGQPSQPYISIGNVLQSAPPASPDSSKNLPVASDPVPTQSQQEPTSAAPNIEKQNMF